MPAFADRLPTPCSLSLPVQLPEASIFATMYEHAGDWDMAWDPDVHFVRSNDFFKSLAKKVAAPRARPARLPA